MTQGDFIKVDHYTNSGQVQSVIRRIEEWDYTKPLAVTFDSYSNDIYESSRSLSQNALFHVWCRDMSEHFIKKVQTATPENIKLMMKHRFLGVQDIKVGKTVIKDQVKSSSSLTKGEMVHFMDKVYHWARDNGCMLKVPADSEYQKLLNQQES